MTKICKYSLPIQESVDLKLPKNSEIIRVDVVDGLPFIWAISDLSKETEVVTLEMYKTGQEFKTESKDLLYLGNCKLIVGQELCIYIFKKLK